LAQPLPLFKKVVQIYLLEKGKPKNLCYLAQPLPLFKKVVQPLVKVSFGSTFLKRWKKVDLNLKRKYINNI
jgi:hypothetical protein